MRQYMSDDARGGNDQLWGDAIGAVAGGADTFLFAGAIGRDIVFDFRPDEGDVIELRDYGFDDVGDLSIAVAGGSTVIDIGASLGQTANVDTIRLAGFNDALDEHGFRVHLRRPPASGAAGRDAALASGRDPARQWRP